VAQGVASGRCVAGRWQWVREIMENIGFFLEYCGNDGGEEFQEGNARVQDRAQASSPLREGGAALRSGCPWRVFDGRMERAAGGVLRGAVEGAFASPEEERLAVLRCSGHVGIVATATRSTPPVAAPGARLACSMLPPSMAAPPPLGEGCVLSPSFVSFVAEIPPASLPRKFFPTIGKPGFCQRAIGLCRGQGGYRPAGGGGPRFRLNWGGDVV
jgi:hypothetical protein